MNWRQSKPSLQSLEKTPKGKCILSTRQSLNIFLSYLGSSQHLFPAKQLFQQCALLSISSSLNPSTWLFTHSPPSPLGSTYPASASLSLPSSPGIPIVAPLSSAFSSLCDPSLHHWGKSQENYARNFLRRELLEISIGKEVLNIRVCMFLIPTHPFYRSPNWSIIIIILLLL